MLELRLLGHPQIQQNGTELTNLKKGKPLALFAYLAVTKRAHSRSVLAGLLWGDMSESTARKNLTKALGVLRPHLEEYLTITPQTIAFDGDSDYWLDVEDFEAKIDDGAIPHLQEAVQLYEEDFLAGFYVRSAPEFEEWVSAQQSHLQEACLQALQTLVAHFFEQGQTNWKQAIDYASRLLQLEPWHEGTHRQLMRLLALSGQRGAALAQYETCRTVLAEELGR